MGKRQLNETSMVSNSTVEELQRQISMLENERGCTVDKKESDMVVANPKVKGTRSDKTNDSRDSSEHQTRNT